MFNKKPKPKIKIKSKVKLGLALSGGGALGLAYIGVIKAFEELGIKFDYIAGTSTGAVVGSMLASGATSDQIKDFAKQLKVKDVRNSSFILRPSNAENIAVLLNNFFKKDLMFSELKTPFIAVCTNLTTGKEVWLDYGSVGKAVAGSCAVPGIFRPVIYDDMHLADGGLINNLPTDVVRQMGANIVIAVDLNHSRGFGTSSLSTLKILYSSLGIVMSAGVAPKLAFADVVLQPDLTKFSKANIYSFDERIKAGYDCVMASKDEIIGAISGKPIKQKVKYAKKISRK